PHIPKKEVADYNRELFETLRVLRKETAEEDGVPPYVLFSDATLTDICRYFPETKEDMLSIKGIGPKRYEQYGERFLQEIKTWLEENPQDHERVQIQSASTPGYRRVQAEISDE